jgi:hypothetical protein
MAIGRLCKIENSDTKSFMKIELKSKELPLVQSNKSK